MKGKIEYSRFYYLPYDQQVVNLIYWCNYLCKILVYGAELVWSSKWLGSWWLGTEGKVINTAFSYLVRSLFEIETTARQLKICTLRPVCSCGSMQVLVCTVKSLITFDNYFSCKDLPCLLWMAQMKNMYKHYFILKNLSRKVMEQVAYAVCCLEFAAYKFCGY